MDLGVHMMVMDEWNECTEWDWQPATVFLQGYYTRVVQEDGIGGLHIATYVTNGEGNLKSLRVYTTAVGSTHHEPAPYNMKHINEAKKDGYAMGIEYIYH